ncbi:citrate synthase [Devosia sp. Root436]|uniref:citrate synthase n=1 Tax=Devosia sp. Root436 TaxID=1736537 RepID=UPI0006FBC5B1|nr:citrate synthase [Devosia sp. Root436]KQX43129.1 citrate synthase [Devosia sp. Root436]
MDWLSATEALTLLGTQKQTLYANVSRGRIKARPDPADSRRSLYRGDDVRRLAQRAAGRRRQEVVATEAMHWGEPVLRTAISTVEGGRLLYRGEDACDLSHAASLEDIATLLWQAPARPATAGQGAGQGLAAAFAALAARAAQPVVMGQSAALLVHEANLVLGTLAQALTGDGNADAPLHMRLAFHWGRAEAADAIRRALVLLADHELNASTFAARVTVSTGASLWAGTLAGLAALSGPRHGLASRGIAALVDDIGDLPDAAAEPALRDWLGEGRDVPGMGHPLYPHGDPRCQALLASFAPMPAFQTYRMAAQSLTGDLPNIDFALAALTARFDLPADAGLVLFAMGRSVGWLAHMMEQIGSGQSIRPRARYVGPAAR